MFVLAYGAMVAYLIIIKDTVPVILGLGSSFMEKEMIVVATSVLFIIPLSLQRDMASLGFTSLLSVTADVILVGFVAAFAPIKESVAEAGGFGRILQDNSINSNLFIGLGILSTAMACQHSAFIVSGSLSNKTSQRWGAVTFRSITTSACLCAIMAVCGYLGYLETTKGNILTNFPDDSVESNGARALLAITMIFTYPMELFVARHVFVKLLYNGDSDGPIDPTTGNPVGGWFGRRQRITLLIYVMTLIPALVFHDIGPVLSVTGSLGGSLLSYVAPGMTYLGVNGEAFLAYLNNVIDSKKRSSNKESNGTGDIELPVVGDANTVMQVENTSSGYPTGSKPWWWFPTLMPVWCALAASGATSMRAKLGRHEQQAEQQNGNGTMSAKDVEEIHPVPRDYFISMLFILFGVLGAVAGLGSNIWVEVNKTFFSPH